MSHVQVFHAVPHCAASVLCSCRTKPRDGMTRQPGPCVVRMPAGSDSCLKSASRFSNSVAREAPSSCLGSLCLPLDPLNALPPHRDVFYNRYNTGKPALVIVGGAIGGAMFFAGAPRVSMLFACCFRTFARD